MSEFAYDILTTISTVDTILLFVCLLTLLLYRSMLADQFRIFTAFIGLSFVTQTLALVLPEFWKISNNLWLLHVYTLGEFILLSLFYYRLFKDESIFQNLIKILLPPVAILIVLNTIFLQPITGFNSNAKTLVQIMLIAYAIYYFYIVSTREILVDKEIKALHTINSAILLYYAGSLFIFMFNNIAVLLYKKMSPGFWLFNGILYFVFLIIILVGIWKAIFKPQNSTL